MTFKELLKETQASAAPAHTVSHKPGETVSYLGQPHKYVAPLAHLPSYHRLVSPRGGNVDAHEDDFK